MTLGDVRVENKIQTRSETCAINGMALDNKNGIIKQVIFMRVTTILCCQKYIYGVKFSDVRICMYIHSYMGVSSKLILIAKIIGRCHVCICI